MNPLNAIWVQDNNQLIIIGEGVELRMELNITDFLRQTVNGAKLLSAYI